MYFTPYEETGKTKGTEQATKFLTRSPYAVHLVQERNGRKATRHQHREQVESIFLFFFQTSRESVMWCSFAMSFHWKVFSFVFSWRIKPRSPLASLWMHKQSPNKDLMFFFSIVHFAWWTDFLFFLSSQGNLETLYWTCNNQLTSPSYSLDHQLLAMCMTFRYECVTIRHQNMQLIPKKNSQESNQSCSKPAINFGFPVSFFRRPTPYHYVQGAAVRI